MNLYEFRNDFSELSITGYEQAFFAFFITMLCFAVLEFELRKAQETIKSLRASLTQEAGKLF